MSQPSRPDDEPSANIDIGDFPNGLPRVVHTTKLVDGILHIWLNGVETPIWSDHQLMVEMGWAACSYVHPVREWDYDDHAPLKIVDDHLGYEATAQDAFDTAFRIQKELEQQGEYVPIYVRY